LGVPYLRNKAVLYFYRMNKDVDENSDRDTVYIPKPGDRIFRVPRMQPWRIILPEIHRKRPLGISLLNFISSFILLILLGAVLLMLPVSSRDGQWTSFLTSLFTATSSITLTGLNLVDTGGYWSIFGQAVILFLVQIGGLGIMCGASIFLLASSRHAGLNGTVVLGKSTSVSYSGGALRLIRNVVCFALIVETIGILISYYPFYLQYGPITGLWQATFQSISAFNNAGFHLFSTFRNALQMPYAYLIMLSYSLLILIGSLGFLVFNDLFRSRGIRKSPAETRIVLLTTLILLFSGALIILIVEFKNPQTLGSFPLSDRIFYSVFQSLSARTAGFDLIGIPSMSIYTLFFIMVFMYIGGAVSSTAGGIKVNTAGLLAATIWSTIRGREHPGAFGREFPPQNVYRALTLLVISLGFILAVFITLAFFENFPFTGILFETISAFGNVGFTTGITPALSIVSKAVLILTMFVGRMGPLILISILLKRQHPSNYRYPQETIRLG